ncbi:hypothetical protein [Winogradskyella sp. A3E31]|uniref:hypothetical protein n=1 Tax=Winogradskyella sp. A3E31 TaxID=3349637 RepID=UPI00398AD90A
MSQDYNNPAFKKLLQKLQEESWQLELIISGFAIFGLFSIFDPISVALTAAENDEKIYMVIILMVALVSCAILALNLILHVILRGLWIGALGLRYVSGDIDYDYLNYSPKFTKYLKKRVGSFDRYIARLEDYCSIIFAISFLLIFYVLALTFTIVCIALIANYILDNDNLNKTFRLWLGIPMMLFITIGMFITFIDFVTQGWLKKKKWISKIYFPVYWVFSFITLSFLYRPIVYNFLDNKFGKRLSFLLVPLFILILIGSSFVYERSNYFGEDLNSNTIIANSLNYEDLLTEDADFIKRAAISSKVITDPFIKIFLVLDENIEDNVVDFNQGLKPENDIRGLNSKMFFDSNFRWSKRDSLQKEYIKTLNYVYSVKIDTITYKSDFILGESLKKQRGFESYIGIKDLPEGKHLLNIIRKRIIRNNDTVSTYVARIPFWYYPN